MNVLKILGQGEPMFRKILVAGALGDAVFLELLCQSSSPSGPSNEHQNVTLKAHPSERSSNPKYGREQRHCDLKIILEDRTDDRMSNKRAKRNDLDAGQHSLLQTPTESSLHTRLALWRLATTILLCE